MRSAISSCHRGFTAERRFQAKAQSVGFLGVELKWGFVVNALPPYNDSYQSPSPDQTSWAETQQYLTHLLAQFSTNSIFSGDFHMGEAELEPFLPLGYRAYGAKPNFKDSKGNERSMCKGVSAMPLVSQSEQVFGIPADSKMRHSPVLISLQIN